MSKISYVEQATKFIEEEIKKNLIEFKKIGNTYGEKVEIFCYDLGTYYWFNLITFTLKMKSITRDDVVEMKPNFFKFMDKVIDNISIRKTFINNN